MAPVSVDDVHRSAEKDGITVALDPPSFGTLPMAVLQVKSKCVDIGAASHAIVDGYDGNTDADKYDDADASKSPIPTTFPSPMG